MTTFDLTLRLPEPVIRRLQEAAAASRRSLEDIAAQSLEGNLPPSLASVPVDMQDELMALQSLSDEALLAAAQTQIPPGQQSRHLTLLDRNSEGGLSAGELVELAGLREEADRVMLRRAHAWSILRWRGHSVPSLDELPLDPP